MYSRNAAGRFCHAMLARKHPDAFATNKRWLNRRMKAVLAEARAAHETHRKGARRRVPDMMTRVKSENRVPFEHILWLAFVASPRHFMECF